MLRQTAVKVNRSTDSRIITLLSGIHPDGTLITERKSQNNRGTDTSVLPPHLRDTFQPIEIPAHLRDAFQPVEIPAHLRDAFQPVEIPDHLRSAYQSVYSV
ncbi:hypothetical protein F4X90_22465 [Candidatus Poribacteria bacterium]|nr:hypothetical protein [Candidatus Poribacteria bacterium]